MTPMLKIVKPSTDEEKHTKTVTDTIEVTPEMARGWKMPPFQRPLRVNTKVIDLSQEIAKTHVIPGTLTIGVMGADRWLIDGQHRRESFLLSEAPFAYVDVRFCHFKTMMEMAHEFYTLNSRLSQMRPDDYLRALESSNDVLGRLRRECPFVGYDNVRRGPSTPVLSMSALVRCWWASAKDVPTGGGESAIEILKAFPTEDADHLVSFLKIAFDSWGRESENVRLWGNLTLVICMWLYRRLVMSTYSAKTERMSKDQFKKCLLSLAADESFVDWLVGRQLSERDRSPAYTKIKTAFANRVEHDTGRKPMMPSPAWSSHSGGGKKKTA